MNEPKPTSYRETFRRHRRLLSVPMVLGAVIAAWFALGTAKTYESSASLWVDSPATMSSSLGDLNPAVAPPSTQEQSVLTELLTTRQFDLGVAHHSLLGRYLATHPYAGFSPTALISHLSSPLPMVGRIMGDLTPKQVTTTLPGPQVLQISFDGPTPAVARSTLAAIVYMLQQDSSQLGQQHGKTAVAYYGAQMRAATQALTAATNEYQLYRSQHPNAPAGDPNLSALASAEGSARAQLTQDNALLNEAQSTLGVGSGGSSIQIVDAASLPPGPLSGKSKELETILAGLLAGALVSLLGTIAMTRGRRDPWEDELAGSLPTAGRPVGAQPELRSEPAPAEAEPAPAEAEPAPAPAGPAPDPAASNGNGRSKKRSSDRGAKKDALPNKARTRSNGSPGSSRLAAAESTDWTWTDRPVSGPAAKEPSEHRRTVAARVGA